MRFLFVFSFRSGELIQWNIRDISKPKYQIISPGSLHRGHNRIVFNIVTTGPDSNTLVSISMDRQVVQFIVIVTTLKKIQDKYLGFQHVW